MKRRITVLAVLVGLVVAGVLGAVALNEDDSTDNNDTVTATPTVTPTEDEETLDAIFPKGVSNSSVIPSRISEEYQTKLEKSTYVLTEVISSSTENGSKTERVVQQRGEEAAILTTSINGEVVLEQYMDYEEGTLYEYYPQAKNDQYRVLNRTSLPTENSRTIHDIFATSKWKVTGTTKLRKEAVEVTLEDGRPLNLSRVEGRFSQSNVTEIDAESIIRTNGLVKRLSIYIGSEDGGVNYNSRIDALNNTVVTEPDWVAEARSEGNVQNGISSNGRVIFGTYSDSSQVDRGATVRIYETQGNDFTKYNSVLRSDLKQGNTLYISLENGTAYTGVDEQPLKQGKVLTADSYYVQVVPENESEPMMEFEVVPEDD